MVTFLIIFTLIMVAWAIVGGVFGLSLYDDSYMPHPNRFKNSVALFALGPSWWFIRGLLKPFMLLKNWLRKDIGGNMNDL